MINGCREVRIELERTLQLGLGRVVIPLVVHLVHAEREIDFRNGIVQLQRSLRRCLRGGVHAFGERAVPQYRVAKRQRGVNPGIGLALFDERLEYLDAPTPHAIIGLGEQVHAAQIGVEDVRVNRFRS